MNDYLIASAKESLTNTKLLRLGLGHQFTRKLWQLVTSLLFLASLPPLMEQPEPPQQQRHANWDDALEECLASSQEDERSVEGADACRSSTSDDEDDPSEIHWWLPRLKTASKKALPNMAFPTQMNLKRIISGCTGCGAEISVFKASLGSEIKTGVRGTVSSEVNMVKLVQTCSVLECSTAEI